MTMPYLPVRKSLVKQILFLGALDSPEVRDIRCLNCLCCHLSSNVNLLVLKVQYKTMLYKVFSKVKAKST